MKRYISLMLALLIALTVFMGAMAEELPDPGNIDEYLEGVGFTTFSFHGMVIPLIEAEGWTISEQHMKEFGKLSRFENREEKLVILDEAYVSTLTSFYEDPEKAPDCYKSFLQSERELQKEMIEIDGHPALIATYDRRNTEKYFSGHVGAIYYVRQNKLLQILLTAKSTERWAYAQFTPTVTMDHLKMIAEHISYDPTQAPVTEEDVAITVTPKKEVTALSAGQNLELDAAFVDPETAKKNSTVENYDRFVWSVIDTATGKEVEEVQLNKVKTQQDKRWFVTSGKATEKSIAATKMTHQKVQVTNKLERVVYAEIVAESYVYHTKAIYPVILLPKVKKMTLEPVKASLYAGSDQTATFTLTTEPELPVEVLAWGAARDGYIELTPGDDGTVTVRPAGKGSTKVIVTEPGGKKAAADIQIVEPVEQIELSFSGKPKTGGKVSVKANVLPKTAGDKKVEWTVDTEETVAKIDKGGSVSIGKETPVGTVITVTCTAQGAPEPVTAQIQITTE